MLKTIRRCCLAGLATAVFAAPQVLFGREPNLADVAYGDGVQAYFSGDSADAERQLAAAIENIPDDPRPHYYRGLSLLRLGRTAEARRELAAGATLEAQRPGRYPVGRSLERVQGRDRLLLEEFRQQGRAKISSLRSERRRTRYEQQAGGDAQALRQQVAVPLEDLIEPSKLPDWTRSSDAIVSPQETAAAQELMRLDAANTTTAETASADTASDVVDDPFADDSESALMTDAEVADPFAVDAAASPGGQKIPPEKMWGIMGRVLRRAAPLPSLEGLGGNVPFVPGGPTSDESFDAFGDTADGPAAALPDAGSSPFDFGQPPSDTDRGDNADPFGSPIGQPVAPSDENDGAAATPSEPLDDDPFGGF